MRLHASTLCLSMSKLRTTFIFFFVHYPFAKASPARSIFSLFQTTCAAARSIFACREVYFCLQRCPFLPFAARSIFALFQTSSFLNTVPRGTTSRSFDTPETYVGTEFLAWRNSGTFPSSITVYLKNICWDRLVPYRQKTALTGQRYITFTVKNSSSFCLVILKFRLCSVGKSLVYIFKLTWPPARGHWGCFIRSTNYDLTMKL